VVAVGFLGGCSGGEESSSPTGSSSTSSTSSTSTTSTNTQCVVTPELTEGPYFVDEMLNRSDIRTDPATGVPRPGVALALELVLSQVAASGCGPLAGALVDLWHCDASGLYSDVSQQRTNGQAFLRGYQLSDANGSARFTTIYPGWYPGRAVHIHFKVRTTPTGSSGLEFTSQLFFDEALTDQVYTQAPYNSRGRRDTLITTTASSGAAARASWCRSPPRAAGTLEGCTSACGPSSLTSERVLDGDPAELAPGRVASRSN
jgi:protocatechuate 3,4-dioxygenase beta subunit